MQLARYSARMPTNVRCPSKHTYNCVIAYVHGTTIHSTACEHIEVKISKRIGRFLCRFISFSLSLSLSHDSFINVLADDDFSARQLPRLKLLSRQINITRTTDCRNHNFLSNRHYVLPLLYVALIKLLEHE